MQRRPVDVRGLWLVGVRPPRRGGRQTGATIALAPPALALGTRSARGGRSSMPGARARQPRGGDRGRDDERARAADRVAHAASDQTRRSPDVRTLARTALPYPAIGW